MKLFLVPDLQGFGSFDVHADMSPASCKVHIWFPDVLVVSLLVSGKDREDVSWILVSVVEEGQTARHWH